MSTRVACAVALLVVVAGPTAQDRPTNDDRREEQLTDYLRRGQYADARDLIDRMLRDEPREDLENVRAVFAIGPNMRIRQAPATFACAVSDTGVRLPVTVEGTPVEWLLDTGANMPRQSGSAWPSGIPTAARATSPAAPSPRGWRWPGAS